MKKLTLWVYGAGWLLASPVQADYLIYLSNGRQIHAVSHREENQQLKIQTERGEFGVPLRNVVKIESIADRKRGQYNYYQSSGGKAAEEKAEPVNTSAPPPQQGFTTSPEADKEKYVSELKAKMKNEKWPAKFKEWDGGKDDADINAEYEVVKGKKDLLASMSPDEMKNYMQQIDALKKLIIDKNKVSNYASELKDLHSIGDTIEERTK